MNVRSHARIDGLTMPNWLWWPLELSADEMSHAAVIDLPSSEMTLLCASDLVAGVEGKSLADDAGRLRIAVTSTSRARSSRLEAKAARVAAAYVVSNVVFGSDLTRAIAGELIVWVHDSDRYELEARTYKNATVIHGVAVEVRH